MGWAGRLPKALTTSSRPPSRIRPSSGQLLRLKMRASRPGERWTWDGQERQPSFVTLLARLLGKRLQLVD